MKKEIRVFFPLVIALASGYLISNFFLITTSSHTNSIVRSREIDPKNLICDTHIRYIALEDSYTVGKGLPLDKTYPYLLVNSLQKKHIPITLTANLGVDGYSTISVINTELPQFKTLYPQFITLLIGVNDVAYSTPITYQKNLDNILHSLTSLRIKNKIIILTLPDLTKSPQGKLYKNPYRVEQTLKAFNTDIKTEANKYNLGLADIYSVSQIVQPTDEYFIDSLHPNTKQYSQWNKVIYQQAYTILK